MPSKDTFISIVSNGNVLSQNLPAGQMCFDIISQMFIDLAPNVVGIDCEIGTAPKGDVASRQQDKRTTA